MPRLHSQSHLRSRSSSDQLIALSALSASEQFGQAATSWPSGLASATMEKDTWARAAPAHTRASTAGSHQRTRHIFSLLRFRPISDAMEAIAKALAAV